MKKETWSRRIKKVMQDAGTYKPCFDFMIDTLAGILENRDLAQQAYENSGQQPVVIHVNKGGNSNIVKNPALVVVMDCNAQALAYWRDLGLTPAGYKRLNAEAVQKETTNGLEALLEKMME